MKNQETKERVPVWLDMPVVKKLESLLEIENMPNLSQLIARAVDFYLGYLGTSDATEFLSQTLVGVVDSSIRQTEGRNATNLFRLAVEMNIIMRILADGMDIPMSQYLFTDDNGTLIHPDTFSKRLRKIYDEMNFSKDFHLHTLRHYFVSAMLHSGVDKQTVADIAGHGDTSFLERTYCHPQTLAKQKAAVSMANMMFGGTAYVNENGVEQLVRIA